MATWKVHTVADFRVGQEVWVHADQGFRHGEVTKLGRTRVTVLHPRNQRGTMAERPYGMESIVVGQSEHPNDWGWGVVTAAGTWWALGEATRRNGDPRLPRVRRRSLWTAQFLPDWYQGDERNDVKAMQLDLQAGVTREQVYAVVKKLYGPADADDLVELDNASDEEIQVVIDIDELCEYLWQYVCRICDEEEAR